jgi:hypothetical protein
MYIDSWAKKTDNIEIITLVWKEILPQRPILLGGFENYIELIHAIDEERIRQVSHVLLNNSF